MTNPSLYTLSWHQFHADVEILADRIGRLRPWKTLVAVTRGGLAPAAILSQMLDIRLVETICLVSYKDHAQGQMNILKAFESKGEDTLVIDDLSDSGATLRAVRQMLPQAHLSTVYAKPNGVDAVDTYARLMPQNQWLVFPWEESAEDQRKVMG